MSVTYCSGKCHILFPNRHKVMFSIFCIFMWHATNSSFKRVVWQMQYCWHSAAWQCSKWDDLLYDKSLVSQICMLILPQDNIGCILVFWMDGDEKLGDILGNLYRWIKTFNVRHVLLEGITILGPTSLTT